MRAIVLLAHSGHLDKAGINAQRNPGHPEVTPVTIPFIATIPPIGGGVHEDWLAGFTVTGPG